MLAVKGICSNGVITLIEKVPATESEVLVIFPGVNEESRPNTPNNEIAVKKSLR